MTNPVQPDNKGGNNARMVPETDLVYWKRKANKVEGELESERKARAEAEAKLKIAISNLDDSEEATKVRRGISDEWDKLKADRDAYEKSRTEFEGERKSHLISQLATRYGVDEAAIADKDDPEKEALKLYAERLTANPPQHQIANNPANIFDGSNPAVTRPNIAAIDPTTPEGRAELAKVEARFKAEAAVAAKK